MSTLGLHFQGGGEQWLPKAPVQVLVVINKKLREMISERAESHMRGFLTLNVKSLGGDFLITLSAVTSSYPPLFCFMALLSSRHCNRV